VLLCSGATLVLYLQINQNAGAGCPASLVAARCSLSSGYRLSLSPPPPACRYVIRDTLRLRLKKRPQAPGPCLDITKQKTRGGLFVALPPPPPPRLASPRQRSCLRQPRRYQLWRHLGPVSSNQNAGARPRCRHRFDVLRLEKRPLLRYNKAKKPAWSVCGAPTPVFPSSCLPAPGTPHSSLLHLDVAVLIQTLQVESVVLRNDIVVVSHLVVRLDLQFQLQLKL
jgi:hypothetical protein